MKRIAAAILLVVLMGLCAPSFADNSQLIWQRQAQKNANKAQKQQRKAYRKAIKQEKKMMKKQRKQALKDAKTWKHSRV